MAADSLNSQLLTACTEGDLAEVSRLLDEGADAAYQDAEGVSGLMMAAENGHAEVVGILLEAGSPWNAQDKDGYTAGEYATACKRQDIVELLMEWGVQAELLLGAASRADRDSSTTCSTSATYLSQRLTYQGDKLLDADGEAVMMGWEGPLMEHHAREICAAGGDILNIGFGLGLVDDFIQQHQPTSHTIVEAHPDVYAHMCELGWDKRPGVKILFGRWQDMLPQMQTYDGIFFDTYGEYYEEMHDFHLQLPKLLKPTGVYSFFNGLASDNLFFHMVYGRVIQVELAALGISTRYQHLPLGQLGDEVWQGVRSKYWHFPLYFLPVCRKEREVPSEEASRDAGAAQAAEAVTRLERGPSAAHHH